MPVNGKAIINRNRLNTRCRLIVCRAGFDPNKKIISGTKTINNVARIAPLPRKRRLATIIRREIIGADKVSTYAINAPPKFAPNIIAAAAINGRIDCEANVTNNKTAATLECTTHAKVAPIIKAVKRSRPKYSITICVPGFAIIGPVEARIISKDTKIKDKPIRIRPT